MTFDSFREVVRWWSREQERLEVEALLGEHAPRAWACQLDEMATAAHEREIALRKASWGQLTGGHPVAEREAERAKRWAYFCRARARLLRSVA